MRLKSLQLQGFKSFPDKITIEYDEGITAIVGPNGSGKSNIVDAVRWVLGEQSTKTLRGAKMEDVIFGGTTLRAQVGFAEVSLNLDNSDGSLQSEYSEVTVTRRFYRSGESEYYINRKQCRLKDVNELFMNTGVGKDGYSMIGQGKIAEILSLRSEDRRAIFEEAAGISKYRYRKNESEKKLASCEENLVRLRDLLVELEARVEPLRVQSEKARRYLDYRETRRRLEIDVWLYDLGKVNAQIEKITGDSLALSQELSRAFSEVEEVERRMDEAVGKTAEINIKIEEKLARIRAAEERSAGLAGEIAVARNDISHAEARIEELRRSAEARQGDEFDARIAEKKTEIEKQRLKLAEIGGEIEKLEQKNREALEKARLKLDEKEACGAELSIKSAEKTELELTKRQLAAAIGAADLRAAELSAELAEKKADLASKNEGAEATRARLAAATERITESENVIVGYEKRRETRSARSEAAKNEAEKFERALFEKIKRREMLAELDAAGEGFSHSVKRVLTDGRRGVLKGIVGTVASLITVSPEHTVAVETALAGAIQNVVVENEKSAKTAISLLKREKAGRATFLPLDTVKSRAERKLTGQTGYIGLASSLIECDAKYRAAIEYILGGCHVADTLDHATAIAAANGYSVKLVTLDGQIVHRGGKLTGGSQQKDIGFLSRKNEIARLDGEIGKERVKAAELSAAAERLLEEAQSVEAQLEGARADLQNAREAALKENGELSVYSAYIEALEQNIEALEKEQGFHKEEQRCRSEELAKADEKIAAANLQIAKLERKISELGGSEEEAAANAGAAADEIQKLRLAEVERRAAEQAASVGCEELERQKRLYLEREAELLREIEAQAEKKAQLERHALELQDEDKKAGGEAERLREEQKKLISERDGLEKLRGELRSASREKLELREKLSKEELRLENKKAAVEGEYDRVASKLWDEYELTISAAEQLKRPIEDLSAARSAIAELKGKMKSLGNINVDSIEEYKQVSERYEFYTEQVGDLERSKSELVKIIDDLTEMMKQMFKKQFALINEKFGVVFADLFGGGSASLELSDPSDCLQSGIEIAVNPPGKKIKSLQLLSGGEQTFVAIALYFAILSVKPVPFCIMDEIEAALDEVNVTRFAAYMKRFTDKTQFIVVTHRRGTMEAADMLYGVTMQEKGVSKILAINVGEIERKLKIKI